MAPERLDPGKRCFSYVGIDCFGPFYVKVGRSDIIRYGCLFTCLSPRAVHLEKLCNLDTDAFLNGFRRFIGHRGMTTKVWSDNGTNVVSCTCRTMQRVKIVKQGTNQVACCLERC